MGRYTGPVCRLCRQVGGKLFLKGERCFSPKCAVERRREVPGYHRSARRRRQSDRAIQLKEKQKLRYIYGTMERQFRRYMDEALAQTGVTGQYLLQQLERRLDNVVFRLSFAESRRQARQLVRHGHLLVNGRKVNIPSYRVKPEDVVSWKEPSQKRDFFKVLVEDAPKHPVPSWLNLDTTAMTGRVLRLPAAEELEPIVDPRLVVEYYSR
ncbi:MAG: 30S ribosomal protein S4 [Dehalococcoidia bacterium]